MAEMRKTEEEQLRDLTRRMSKDQQKDMAEILSAELRRRAEQKAKGPSVGMASKVQNSPLSTSLSREDVSELYGNVKDAVQKARLARLEKQVAEAKRQSRRLGAKAAAGRVLPKIALPKCNFSLPNASVGRLAIMYGIVLLGAAKILFSTGVVDASTSTRDNGAEHQARPAASDTESKSSALSGGTVDAAPLPMPERIAAAAVSPSERQLLTALDARRVELERRSNALDKREEDLNNQSKALAERLAELRSLTDRLGERRQEKEHRYEARLEQLANIYDSMAPNEAAPLIAKLDDQTSLSLLQRMSGKRIGQILSAMPQDKAIQLTKQLSDQKTVE